MLCVTALYVAYGPRVSAGDSTRRTYCLIHIHNNPNQDVSTAEYLSLDIHINYLLFDAINL